MTGELQKTVEALQQQLCSETGLLNEKSAELEHLRSHHTEQSTMLEHKLAKELGEENIKGTLQYFVTPAQGFPRLGGMGGDPTPSAIGELTSF